MVYNQEKAINDIYDAQKSARQSELSAAYERNVNEAQAAADKIPQTYQQRANDLSVQYERNRRNLNQQADMSGLNTGAGSQQALALNNVYQREYGGIQKAQADAQTEAQRGIANLRADYERDVNSAIAQNDYQRASALLDEYNNQYQRNVNEAKTLAQYGDFTKYGDIYGTDAAQAAQQAWIGGNPQLAWYMGKISPDDYYKLTGQHPAGYTAPGSGVPINQLPIYNPGGNESSNAKNESSNAKNESSNAKNESSNAKEKPLFRGEVIREIEKAKAEKAITDEEYDALYRKLGTLR